MLQRTQAMRNNERGAALHQALQSADDGLFRPSIDGTRWLVENEDGRVLEKSAGERDALALAARQAHATLTDLRLVSVRQASDELMRVRQLRRFDDLLDTGLRPSVCDVLGDGGCKGER